MDPSSAILSGRTWSVFCLIHVPLASAERCITYKWTSVCGWNVITCTYCVPSCLHVWTAMVIRSLSVYIGPPLLLGTNTLEEFWHLTDRATQSIYLSNWPNWCTKFLFYNKFISCLYMFRAHVLIIRRSKLHYTSSGIITPIGGRLVHSTRRHQVG